MNVVRENEGILRRGGYEGKERWVRGEGEVGRRGRRGG